MQFSTSCIRSHPFAGRSCNHTLPFPPPNFFIQLLTAHCRISIMLKNPMNASTRLSMNGKSPMISITPPFVPSSSSGQALRLSNDDRKVFQQNHDTRTDPSNLAFFSTLACQYKTRSTVLCWPGIQLNVLNVMGGVFGEAQRLVQQRTVLRLWGRSALTDSL